MKYCVIFCLFVGTTLELVHGLTKWTPDQINEVRIDCLKKFPVPEEKLELFKKFEYPDEEIIDNYGHCLGVKLQFFTDTEGFNAEHLETQFGNDKADIIKKCMTFQKDHPDWTFGQWAMTDWRCFEKQGLLTEEFKNIDWP